MGKSDGRFSGMVFSDFALDPAKSNQLSLGEKRKLVHEVIEFSEDAPKILSSLTRRELLEIICAEMGQERKYTGLSKMRMIKHLLNVVSKKYKKKSELGSKKQRKQESPGKPCQLGQDSCVEKKETLVCENLACKAIMKGDDAFCKRCSCCICYEFDDNKDPSLWLTCDSDPPFEGESCGISCHLKCAAAHKQAGILKNGIHGKLDGGFYCVSCGKVNGLMRTWRKQILAAKEARRVDILCLRVSLSHKILQGTERYIELLKIIESAAEMLEKEVGPLAWAAKKMDRGIVNRLSCGTEVQKLCATALEAFDLMSSASSYSIDTREPPQFYICFEKLSPTSVTVVLEYEDNQFKDLLGCKLWHRKSTSVDYPPEATYIVLRPEKRFELTNLDPSTEYSCKVSFFSNTKILGIWEAKWVTHRPDKIPGSVSDKRKGERENGSKPRSQVGMIEKRVMSFDDVSKNTTDHGSHVSGPTSAKWVTASPNNIPVSTFEKRIVARENGSKPKPQLSPVEKTLMSFDDISKSTADNGSRVLGPTTDLPPTPAKTDGISKTLSFKEKELEESEYEYSVRVVRRLEHEGHLDRDFRVKFLTWFSLKATIQERRVVSVFVSTLIDDPKCLAAQLIDAFEDMICGERNRVPEHGFCGRLWH